MPGDAAPFWQAIQHSAVVEHALGVAVHLVNIKYLEALAETYRHAISWESRYQALSIMTDLVPCEAIERYILGYQNIKSKLQGNTNMYTDDMESSCSKRIVRA